MTMSGNPKTKVVHAGEGKMIAAAGDLYRFLAGGEHTGQRYAIWEALVPPGGGPPPHVQSREDEGFYILEGEIAFVTDRQKVIGCKGTFLNVPRGVVHSFKNESNVDARMLLIVAPAGMETMFEETGTVVPVRQAVAIDAAGVGEDGPQSLRNTASSTGRKASEIRACMVPCERGPQGPSLTRFMRSLIGSRCPGMPRRSGRPIGFRTRVQKVTIPVFKA